MHLSIVAPAYDIQESVQTWHGVTGAAVMFGGQTTRIISLKVTFGGFASESLLRGHVATVQSHIFDNGTLVVDSISWPLSALLGFDPDAQPFLDGSGTHGYIQMGTLTFRQIRS